MEGADTAFFYTARSFSLSKTIITLVEQPQLEWNGRIAYLGAKLEERRTDLYIGDLVYLLARTKYDLSGKPTPTEYEFKTRRKDERSAQQIKDAIVKKLGA